ncbi:hypothetical protein K443DRAFT_684076 [Laccaria amethystina LaAM-08-1]|uniref:Uncharacterized protein n=1 Tax=Laccaria amethystina LaAM-08-1 TaxID=1095629 RepID=A0A0C9WRK2_9AGAR|nr:hypothetical protein K443DRAFT_684076 [Laccaria amethystina LaAM-08-1]
MHLSFFTLIALFALAAVRAVPAGQPSGAPSCTHTCPSTDQAGFPLGNSSDDGTTLFCSYPAFPGEDPNDFFCKYSSTGGGLRDDNDAGFCPGTAVGSCSTRRRNVLAQPPAPPAPVDVPLVFVPNDKVKVRAQLKKRQARIPSSSSS